MRMLPVLWLHIIWNVTGKILIQSVRPILLILRNRSRWARLIFCFLTLAAKKKKYGKERGGEKWKMVRTEENMD